MRQAHPVVLLAISLPLVGCLSTIDGADVDQASMENRIPAENLTRPVFETVNRTVDVIQGEVEGEEIEEIWLDVYRPAEAGHEVPVIRPC